MGLCISKEPVITITHRTPFGTDTYTQRGSRPVEVASERYAIFPGHQAKANELRAQLGMPVVPIPSREGR